MAVCSHFPLFNKTPSLTAIARLEIPMFGGSQLQTPLGDLEVKAHEMHHYVMEVKENLLSLAELNSVHQNVLDQKMRRVDEQLHWLPKEIDVVAVRDHLLSSAAQHVGTFDLTNILGCGRPGKNVPSYLQGGEVIPSMLDSTRIYHCISKF